MMSCGFLHYVAHRPHFNFNPLRHAIIKNRGQQLMIVPMKDAEY